MHKQNRWWKMKRVCWMVLTCILLTHLPSHAYTKGGLSLELAVDKEHADLTYLLGAEPVKLFVKVSNAIGLPIATSRGFSQIELYNLLIVTDPNGFRYYANIDSPAHKMPPPYFIADLPWGLAETLPATWVRSLTISDLTEKFPVMKTLPGWYTIEARTSFVRFKMTGQDAGLGLIAQLNHPENWSGNVAAAKLQLFISPARGARLKVQVLESNSSLLTPVSQVPVKVFSEAGDEHYNVFCDTNQDGFVDHSDLQAFCRQFGTQTATEGAVDADRDGDSDGKDLSALIKAFGATGPISQNLWDGTPPIMTGTTDLEGWVVWQTDLACLPEADYTVVAKHSGAFSQNSVVTGSSEGWNASCGDSIIRKITFGVIPASATGDLNGDGCVDLNDYNQLIEELSEPAPHEPIFDLNNDGIVTIADARYLVVRFTNPGGASCE